MKIYILYGKEKMLKAKEVSIYLMYPKFKSLKKTLINLISNTSVSVKSVGFVKIDKFIDNNFCLKVIIDHNITSYDELKNYVNEFSKLSKVKSTGIDNFLYTKNREYKIYSKEKSLLNELCFEIRKFKK